MSKFIGLEPQRFLAIRKHKDGGEQVVEYFDSKAECEAWIRKQPQPKNDAWRWYVGEY